MAMSAVAYLSYLCGVSRKILLRGGFENVLYGKSARQNPFYIDAEAAEVDSYVERIGRQLRQEPGRGLFMGFGMITGKSPNEAGRMRRLCAPLLIAPITPPSGDETMDDDEPLSIDWDAFSINYDLITTLLDNFSVTDEEDVTFASTSPVDSHRLDSLSKVEAIVDEFARTRGKTESSIHDFIRRIFKQLQASVPEFSSVHEAQSPFLYKELRSIIDKADLQFFSHHYYFVAPIPDQLSTAAALRKLMRSCEKTGFENPLLARLLSAALENRRVDSSSPGIPTTEIERVIDLLPIGLSQPQRDALMKAWTSEFSYIQGPPGTGKSHTITAIMLTALFLGKRVLMVSHKKAAVDVVHRKLESLLGEQRIIHVSDSADERKQLRAMLRSLCEDSQSLHAHSRLKEFRRDREFLEERVRGYVVKINELRRRIAAELEQQREFIRENTEFLQSRRDFATTFEIHDEPSIRFPTSRVQQNFFNGLEQFKKAANSFSGESTGIPRASLLAARRFLTAVSKRMPVDLRMLRISEATGDYLREYEKLSRQAMRNARAEAFARRSNLAVLRRQFEVAQRELQKLREKFTKVYGTWSLYNLLQRTEAAVQAFRKNAALEKPRSYRRKNGANRHRWIPGHHRDLSPVAGGNETLGTVPAFSLPAL
ncbi:MAG TPA: AAA domain-containing protein [Phycisphaerae bacterium]|nr:AAA domain-containing protein [Phycisphaerae bacterium]